MWIDWLIIMIIGVLLGLSLKALFSKNPSSTCSSCQEGFSLIDQYKRDYKK